MIKTALTESLLRRLAPCLGHHLSTAPQVQGEPRTQSFRTGEADPLKHTTNHASQFYKVPSSEKKIYLYGGLPKSYETQTKTFNETCLMVREPAIDLIKCLNHIDYTKPPVRFVIYGKKGTGKSLTLAHVLHYAHKADFLLVHVPWVGNWMRRCKESSNSESKEGFIDLNLDAAAWLAHFKSQNEDLLSKAEFKTSQEYVWSKRESTPKDSPLLELIDHGINRIKYASDCVLHLSEEIKYLGNSGKCKTMVAIDGFNAFFYPHTRIKTEKKEIVHPHKITITDAFLSLTKFDWKNAVVIVTVDEIAIAEKDQKSHLPRYLLGKDGFHHLDPFIPILVNGYSEKELRSCMDYYRDRKWLQPKNGQDDELAFISGHNPFKLMQYCASL